MVSFYKTRARVRVWDGVGIRMALGARSGDIVPMVMRRGLALIAAGVGIGVLAAMWLNLVLTGFLTDVGSLDPAVFAGAALLILSAAAIACVTPPSALRGWIRSSR